MSAAHAGDARALAAVQTTARYLGLGLGSIVNALDPDRVYIGGEITLAWDVIASTVRAALSAFTASLRIGEDTRKSESTGTSKGCVTLPTRPLFLSRTAMRTS